MAGTLLGSIRRLLSPRSCRVCRMVGASLALAILAISASGCLEQELVVETNPPGALVYMNDQEVGRTPIRRPFTWYGFYDVTVQKEGYETLRTQTPVIAPPWLWVPIDFVIEILPFPIIDRQKLLYTLKPETETTIDPDQVIGRARAMQKEMGFETPQNRKPTTVPSRPATRPSTQPATIP